MNQNAGPIDLPGSTVEESGVPPIPSADALATPQGRNHNATWAIRFGSLMIPLGHAAGQNVVTVLGLRFMTDSLAISAAAAGAMFGFVKIYDGLLDPTVGALSDRARTRWGRRLPFLFAGGIAMPLGIAMLFGAPDFGSVILAQAFITLALMIHASGYTLMTIPGFAMVVESSSDHHERTRLMAWRTYGNAIGTLIGTTVPAWILAGTGPTRPGYLIMALTIAAIVFFFNTLACKLLSAAPRTEPSGNERPFNLVAQAKLAWANHPFRILAMAHIFLLFGTAIGSAAMAYFSRYVLVAGDGWLGTYFVAATIGNVLAIPVWVRLSRIIGKKAGYIAALTLYGSFNFLWFFAGPDTPRVLTSVLPFCTGASGAGMILCAYSMLSDAVRYDFQQSGERREGVFAGITTLFDKLSAAGALAAMGAFLSAMGYLSSTSGATPQSASALLAVRLCVSVIPAISMLGAVLCVSRYRLDPATLSEDRGETA